MKALKIIVFGSFGFVIMLMVSAIARGDISGNDSYYEESYESSYEESYVPEMSEEEMAAYLEGIVDTYSDDTVQPAPQPTPQQASEPAYSDTHQTAPMPDELFSASDLIGKWVDDENPDQVKVVHFFVENNQLMFRHYFIVPGNSIGINIANEVTEWDCCDGMVSVMTNQGNIYCHKGTNPEISISFYYGYDGPNVMYDQERGTAYYRAE